MPFSPDIVFSLLPPFPPIPLYSSPRLFIVSLLPSFPRAPSFSLPQLITLPLSLSPSSGPYTPVSPSHSLLIVHLCLLSLSSSFITLNPAPLPPLILPPFLGSPALPFSLSPFLPSFLLLHAHPATFPRPTLCPHHVLHFLLTHYCFLPPPSPPPSTVNHRPSSFFPVL